MGRPKNSWWLKWATLALPNNSPIAAQEWRRVIT